MKQVINKCIPFFYLLLTVLILTHCEKQEKVRTIKEKKNKPETASTTVKDIKPLKTNIKWQVPQGWQEEGSSGLRLATISIKDRNGDAICTVIPLKDDGGGIKANIIRWLSQLNLQIETETQVDEFIKTQQKFTTIGDLDVTFISFIDLAKTKEETSMLVGIIPLKDQTFFIKMSGPVITLQKYKNQFISFCQSFSLK